MKTLIPTVYIARRENQVYAFSSIESMDEFVGPDTSFILSKNIVNYGTKSSQNIYVGNVKDNELTSIALCTTSALELDQVAVYAKDLMEAVQAITENLRSPFVKAEATGLDKLINLNIPASTETRYEYQRRTYNKSAKDFSVLQNSEHLVIPITQALRMSSYAKLGKTKILNEVLEATEESALLLQRFLAWKLNLNGVAELLRMSARSFQEILHSNNQDGFIYLPKNLLDVYPPRVTA